MQYVIFHGSFGSPDGNWFPWLKKTLELTGNKVILEQFPCEDYESMKDKSFICQKQTLSNWFEFFERNILTKLNVKEEMIFIGHSIAPAFILRVVEKYGINLKKAIFVSPFLGFDDDELWQYKLVNSTILDSPFNFNYIRNHIKESVVFYGDNDPYVPRKEFLNFAEKLGSKLISISKGGHLNSEFGYDEFPQILDEVI